MGLSGDGLKCGTRSFGHTCRMARYASRTRGTADDVGWGIASLVWLLAVVAASFLVLYIILVLFEANPNNDLVNFISDVGCGTRPCNGIRQNRRHVIESETSRHRVS